MAISTSSTVAMTGVYHPGVRSPSPRQFHRLVLGKADGVTKRFVDVGCLKIRRRLPQDKDRHARLPLSTRQPPEVPEAWTLETEDPGYRDFRLPRPDLPLLFRISCEAPDSHSKRSVSRRHPERLPKLTLYFRSRLGIQPKSYCASEPIWI